MVFLGLSISDISLLTRTDRRRWLCRLSLSP